MFDPARPDPARPDSPAVPPGGDPAPAGDPVLAARFAVPAVPRTLVHRPALLARLTAGVRGPLTFVNGPAGAGKTLLAAHWLDPTAGRAPGTAVWLTLEPGDTPDTFWAYVLTALGRRGVRLPDGPGGSGGPDRAPGAGGVDRRLLARLAESLAQAPEPVVLVLDQSDAVPSREVADGLAFVLRCGAPGLRLVMLGRSEPLLPLHRYRAAGEITEIRNADLRFSAEDADTLLRDHGLTVSEGGLRMLVGRTEGWAAGLRLCALAMQRAGDPEAFVREFAADRTTVADYLLTEVLEAQPPATQDLLLRAGVTARIHPGLADALTGRRDGEWTLARLARANAFLEPVDGSAWYRLHPLFAEVLRAHLRHRYPGLEPRLRRRAARWLAGQGLLAEAVAQAAAAGAWRLGAELVVGELALGRLAAGAAPDRLDQLFAGLPPGTPGAAPALVEAAVRLADRDPAGLAAALRRADARLDRAGDPAARLGAAYLGVLGARLAGDPAATGRAAASADRLMPRVAPPLLARHPEIPAAVLAGHGAAELGAGRPASARAHLAAALALRAPPGAEYPPGDCLGSLALAELLLGRLGAARTHAQDALALAEPATRPAALGRLVLAGIASEQDEPAAARDHLAHALSTGAIEPASAVVAAVVGARSAAAAGEPAAALAVLRAAGSRLREAGPGLSPWAAGELAIAESAVHLAGPDPEAALAALAGADPARPESALARARALLAAGNDPEAAAVLAGLPAERDGARPDGATPGGGTGEGDGVGEDSWPAGAVGRVELCLLRAQLAERRGDTGSARRLLGRALTLARPEALRRPFTEAGPWLPGALRSSPQLAQAHGWLPARLLGRTARPYAVLGGRLTVPVEPLSGREREVLGQAAQLLSTEEIAAELYVSVNTVKTHLKSVFRKLGVNRRSEAVRRARELGLL
ncbi:LuxR C-terminal-related transcriptional regulator [Kitasatospora sp. NPDC049258]|uniref:LuxR C-terminal-related transcriptional regulator n=1 Tax=Kitasatospora sp. NPDC049258 TaxID=3155394 RepID=UPI00341548BF